MSSVVGSLMRLREGGWPRSRSWQTPMVEMIRLEAPTYVPYEPMSSVQRAARAELRRRLLTLQAGPGDILHASFAGTLPRHADVENALFYNLDAKDVFSSMLAGVSFEITARPSDGVVYEYETGPAQKEFRHWHTERDLAVLNTDLGDAPPTLASIWWSLRTTTGSIRASPPPRGRDAPFALTLDVAGPAAGLRPGLLKTVLDGTICGLQSQTDDVGAETVAPLIAATVGATTEDVRAALLDADGSALGLRPRLVHPRGSGVQWTPDDDLCVAARVLFSAAEHWRISGSAWTTSPIEGM